MTKILLFLVVGLIFIFLFFLLSPNSNAITEERETYKPVSPSEPLCNSKNFINTYSDNTFSSQCTSVAEDLYQGKIITATQQGVKSFSKKIFPSLEPVTIIDNGKPFCALLVLDVAKNIQQAQCFDNVQDLERVTQNWLKNTH